MSQVALLSLLGLKKDEVTEIVTVAKEIKTLRSGYSALETNTEKIDNINQRLRRIEKILYVKIV